MPSRSAARLVAHAVGIGGGLAFAASLAFFGYAYVTRFDATGTATLAPFAANAGLFTAFALHHSVFARFGVKARLTRLIPDVLERSTYVWVASALFVVVCAAWQPVAGVIWRADGGVRLALTAVQLASGVFVLAAARHLDVLDLAGVRRPLGLRPRHADGLDDHGPYGLVRHPIYLGWIVLVWATPLMNGTRLAFAAISTAYLLAAIPIEERDLRRTHGAAYDRYRSRVRSRVIPWVY